MTENETYKEGGTFKCAPLKQYCKSGSWEKYTLLLWCNPNIEENLTVSLNPAKENKWIVFTVAWPLPESV